MVETQPAFTCSKSTMDAIDVVLVTLLLAHCSSISIFKFEQVNTVKTLDVIPNFLIC